MTLPEEVLVTVMRDHQKYFAVEDAQGKLAPYFLAVLNTRRGASGNEVIRHGNERVLRARFNDARFFWDFDQRISLEDRVEMLKAVTFQKDLGSYLDKTQANCAIAREVGWAVRARRRSWIVCAAEGGAAGEDRPDDGAGKGVHRVAGHCGWALCARSGAGRNGGAGDLLQYSPAATEDPIPPTVEGQMLGLADRFQTIVAMFSIGLEPTGSKDPFALRRAANAIVKILAESELPLDVYSDLLQGCDPLRREKLSAEVWRFSRSG